MRNRNLEIINLPVVATVGLELAEVIGVVNVL